VDQLLGLEEDRLPALRSIVDDPLEEPLGGGLEGKNQAPGTEGDIALLDVAGVSRRGEDLLGRFLEPVPRLRELPAERAQRRRGAVGEVPRRSIFISI
jgi:hypothetical protein